MIIAQVQVAVVGDDDEAMSDEGAPEGGSVFCASDGFEDGRNEASEKGVYEGI